MPSRTGCGIAPIPQGRARMLRIPGVHLCEIAGEQPTLDVAVTYRPDNPNPALCRRLLRSLNAKDRQPLRSACDARWVLSTIEDQHHGRCACSVLDGIDVESDVLGQFCQSVRDAAVVKMHGICCGPQGSGLQV